MPPPSSFSLGPPPLIVAVARKQGNSTSLLDLEFLRDEKFSRSGSYLYCEVPPVRFHCTPQPSSHFAASRPRLAKQNHCALQYRRPIADVEGIGELKLVSSLITHHSPSAPHPSVPSPQSCVFTLPAPVISCYCGQSDPKLSIKSACYAIGPCICPVFTGITVSQ
jgi:hypothetical protein